MSAIILNVVAQGVLTGLAHGELAVVAMYAAYMLFRELGLDPVAAMLPVAAVFFGIGYLLQSALINPFVGPAEHEQFIFLVGLGMVIVNGLLMIFGPDARPTNLSYGLDSYEIGPLLIDKARLLAAAAALVVAGMLFAFFRATAIGTAIRACADNLIGAAVVGLDVKRLYALSFGIGLACVGAAGALMVTIADARPALAQAFTLQAFVIVIVGGLGSMSGALVGGVLIGVSEALAGFFFEPSMKSMFSFALLILVLVLRPQGLRGRRA